MHLKRRTFSAAMLAGVAAPAARTYDAAVVGAGVFGAWTAYWLRKAGKSVLLLDAYGPGNSRASSGGESRIIRMGYGADEIYTRMAARSLRLWKEFPQADGQPLFHRTGVLWIARPDDTRTHESRRTLERAGIAFEFLAQAELAKRYPQIHIERGTTGILEPESGALMARRAVQAVVSEAVRLGCDYLQEGVAAPVRSSPVRTTGSRTVSARAFVFACGPWLPKLFPDVLGDRIFPTRQDVFFFGIPAGDRRFAPPQMTVWIDFGTASGPYGFPDLENRGFKLAFDRHGPPFDPDTGSRLVTPELVREARSYLGVRFPALADAPLVESRVCQYENTSNGDFLIDRHPEWPEIWLVGGGSGHGFKHGPAVGEYAANCILGSGPREPRFALKTKDRVQKRSVY